jgi:CheY-like chemotaxis protein
MDAIRTTDAPAGPVGFIGDLDDPWIAAIADAISTSRTVHRLDCTGLLPEHLFEKLPPPRAIVIHRHKLSPRDADRIAEWRARAGEATPRLVLCISPYVRYAELEPWTGLVDMVVSEATAADVLPGRLVRLIDGGARSRPGPGTLPVRIEVAGGDGELCRALRDACGAAGYPVEAVDDQEIGGIPGPRRRKRSASAAIRVLTIWELPVLEAAWGQRLEWRARRTGPVIALAGFADRAVVARARGSGAVACLELPCDLDDLVDAVDRAVSTTPPESWPIPTRVEPPHVLPPRRNARRQRSLVAPSPWPDRGPLPTIPSQ